MSSVLAVATSDHFFIITCIFSWIFGHACALISVAIVKVSKDKSYFKG